MEPTANIIQMFINAGINVAEKISNLSQKAKNPKEH